MITDRGRRHLAPVDNHAPGLAPVAELPSRAPVPPIARALERVRLSAWQRLEVERCRKLLMDAPELFGTKPPEYVAGLIEGAAANLLDIVDAITDGA